MQRHRVEARDRRIHIALGRVFPLFERLGLHLTRAHFYEPIPELRKLPAGIFERHGEMVGVDMREDEQLELLERFAPYIAECAEFPEREVEDDPQAYFQRNEQFERVDAEVLHAMVRLHRPRRIIEIGAGWSTLIATRAIAMNRADDPSYECQMTSVDPYPRPFVPGLPGLTHLIEKPVQELPLDLFAELGANDILFVDSSHVVKIGSDAQLELLELIPRVNPGVHVQVHDIFFPTDYPKGFVVDWHRFFNEQYVLQAFLAFNTEFSVRWSGSWMSHRRMDKINAAFPSFERGGSWPSSFWMQRNQRIEAAGAQDLSR